MANANLILSSDLRETTVVGDGIIRLSIVGVPTMHLTANAAEELSVALQMAAQKARGERI